MESKKCIKCKLSLEISRDNFRFHKGKFLNVCKKCSYLKEKERRNLKQKECKQKRKEYYEKNKNSYLSKCKEYRLNKIESIRKKDRKRKKENSKRKTYSSITSRIKYTINSRIIRSLNKKKSYIKDLPYTVTELKQHIESQFEPWMTWNNWGKYEADKWNDNDQSTWIWHIDHIKPASTFKYTSIKDDSFKECWSLKNLRPYSAKQNVIDGANRVRHNLI